MSSVGPKVFYKASLIGHIRERFELRAWKQLTIPGDNTIYNKVLL